MIFLQLNNTKDQQSTPLTNTNLFVNYLPPTVSDDILRQMFTAYGEIESCKVMLDLTTGQSRCFGFVKFKTTQEGLLTSFFFFIFVHFTKQNTKNISIFCFFLFAHFPFNLMMLFSIFFQFFFNLSKKKTKNGRKFNFFFFNYFNIVKKKLLFNFILLFCYFLAVGIQN